MDTAHFDDDDDDAGNDDNDSQEDNNDARNGDERNGWQGAGSLHSGALGPLPPDWRWAIVPDQQTDILRREELGDRPDSGDAGDVPPYDLTRLDGLNIPADYGLDGGHGLDPGEEVGADVGPPPPHLHHGAPPPSPPPSPPLSLPVAEDLPPLNADTRVRRLWNLGRQGVRGHARDAYARGDRAEPPGLPGLPARPTVPPDSGPLHRRLAAVGAQGAHSALGRAAPHTVPLSYSPHSPHSPHHLSHPLEYPVAPMSLMSSPGFVLRQREEARMAQIDWMVRDHNTAMTHHVRILPFLHVTIRFPVTARASAFSPGIKPIYEPDMAWYILAQMFPRIARATDREPRESDLALSARLWPPSISYAEIARTVILPDTRPGWGMGAYIENDPVLRLIVAAAWLRLYAQRELVAAALNIAPTDLYDIPASALRCWRPETPQACFFGPISQQTWRDWHARYYTVLFRLLGNLLCNEAQLVPQTAEYLACADHEVPPPGSARYAAVLAHHQRMHPHWSHNTGWRDYIAYLAERNRVPRLLVLSRLYPAPWERMTSRDGQVMPRAQPFDGWWRIGEHEHYRHLMSAIMDESANLSNMRAQVAEHKRLPVDAITLWLMEPLSLVPTVGQQR